jgi:hypothetical protein
MKTSKTVLVAALAILAVTLVTASAYAYIAQPTRTQYGTYAGQTYPYGGYSGGMMRGGMMGNGYSPYSGYGSGTYGYGGCMGGARDWP